VRERKRILIIDSSESNRRRLEACLSGAYDVRSVSSPPEARVVSDRFRPDIVVENVDERSAEQPVGDGLTACGRMLGACPAMLGVFSLIERAARSDAGVVLVGECGTGRELAARTIHELSERRAGPFVSLDAQAFEPDRLEVELLGAGGAGSVAAGGVLAHANDGTLLLGGVEWTSPEFQDRLLGYLRTGRFRRAQGGGHVDADARILTTSERGLDAGLEAGRFRGDLYYLLGVVTVALPPLRERGGDVLQLACHLLHRHMGDGGRIEGFTSGAVSAIASYDWPGNITEMENRIRRAAIVAEGSRVTEADLGLDGSADVPRRNLRQALDRLAREMVEEALGKTLGNVSRAARSIGVSRATMYDMIRKHGIEVRRFKQRPGGVSKRSAPVEGSAVGPERARHGPQRPGGGRGGLLDTPTPVDLQSGRVEAQE